MSRRLPVLLATHTCFANSSKPCTCTNSIISTFVLAVVLMHTFTRRLRACLTHFIATVGTRAWYTNIQQDPFELAFTLEAFALTWHVARNMALLQGRRAPPAYVFVLGWALLGHMHEYHAPVQPRSRLKRDIAVYIAFTRHRSSSYLSDIPGICTSSCSDAYFHSTLTTFSEAFHCHSWHTCLVYEYTTRSVCASISTRGFRVDMARRTKHGFATRETWFC
jgi:hypothetical protein